MALTLILGNQLHSDWYRESSLQLQKKSRVLMIEDLALASHFRYHKLRLLHTFVSMRAFRDELKKHSIDIHYFELPESKKVSFWERVLETLGDEKELQISEVPDRSFQKSLDQFSKKNKIKLKILPSPSFLCSTDEFDTYLGKSKRPFMKTFYERERKRHKILVDRDGLPTGGQWSFDSENRKKTPKDYQEPPLPPVKKSKHETPVREMIEKYFSKNPGELGELFIPYDESGAQEWLQGFLKSRFEDFGPYEDAITSKHDTLNHSLLSPLLNIGLLSPKEVISETLEFAKKHKTPIASVEGFIRQVMGWREFIRGIDHTFGERQAQENFWNHSRKLKPCWYDGTTGIPPLDDAIKKVNRLSYNHHIERLMVLSNLMLLCEIDPREAHRWFMEMYLDSYEWVMGPNVYGMGQMSDGGIFATKPYISGSNYILKMSDYKKGDWCEAWDGLYWSFIDRHRAFFLKNPRLSMMVKLLDKMDPKKRERLFQAAEEFKAKVSTSSTP